MENKPLYVARKGILMKILSFITWSVGVISFSGALLIFLTSILTISGFWKGNIYDEYMVTFISVSLFMFGANLICVSNYVEVKFYNNELGINHSTVFEKKETKFKYKDIYALKRTKSKIYLLCKKRNSMNYKTSNINSMWSEHMFQTEEYYSVIEVKNKHYEKIKEITNICDLETLFNNTCTGELLEEKEYKNKKYLFLKSCIQCYDIKTNYMLKNIDYRFVVSIEKIDKFEYGFLRSQYDCKFIVNYILPDSKKFEKLHISSYYKNLNTKGVRTQYLINWSKFKEISSKICLAQGYDCE